jgi:hypothetical protein
MCIFIFFTGGSGWRAQLSKVRVKVENWLGTSNSNDNSTIQESLVTSINRHPLSPGDSRGYRDGTDSEEDGQSVGVSLNTDQSLLGRGE